jgi:group I intron endonuclease
MEYAGFIYEWTNKLNGMKYIGSHKGKVDDGYKGSGKRFLNALNKYGLDKFERTILEYVIRADDILIREEYYLTTLNCAKSSRYYNISPTARGGDTGSGHKISSTKKKRFASGELVICNKGVAMKEEQKLKLADSWEVTTPDNEVIVITNMREFCEKHNLNPSSMSAVARGKRSNYKGYKCKKLTNKRLVDYEHKEYVFMSKEERSKQLRELAVKGSNHHEAVRIEYEGIIYGSIAEAIEATKKSYYLITKYGKRL